VNFLVTSGFSTVFGAFFFFFFFFLTTSSPEDSPEEKLSISETYSMPNSSASFIFYYLNYFLSSLFAPYDWILLIKDSNSRISSVLFGISLFSLSVPEGYSIDGLAMALIPCMPTGIKLLLVYD
jgi:hypothetical protein